MKRGKEGEEGTSRGDFVSNQRMRTTGTRTGIGIGIGIGEARWKTSQPSTGGGGAEETEERREGGTAER